MNRKLLLMAVAVTVTTAVHAQYVTYNHDSSKQNQVTVMETGTGALSPDLYYSVLHNKYKKSAAAKNKLSFRTLAGINLYNQVDEAEAIDSALVKRAKVEALNVADRQERQNATATSTLLNATDNRTLHKGGIVRNAMSRWQESRLAVRGSQSGGNGNGEDDNESVNRGK